MRIRSWQAVAVPAAIAFIATALETPAGSWPGTAAPSLASGVAALSLMALAAALSARVAVVESWFGGLDRVYLAHKWMGVWALGFASFHLLFKAEADGWDVASILTLPSGVTRLLRQASYVALVFIVLLALNRNIRYSIWRWWHKLSGLLFVAVVLHWLSIGTPIVLASPVGLWLATLSALGIAGALYKLLLYRYLSGHAEYEVTGVEPGANAVRLQLSPVGDAITFVPGQFGFLSLKQEGLREPHPFTIASGRGDAGGRVEFLIRGLGDHTRRLVAGVGVGMRAELHAPYGRFQRPRQANREIWIGGGIGISPFVSWLDDASTGPLDNVSLFYFHTPGRDFPEVAAIEEMARRRGAECMPVAADATSEAFSARLAAIVSESGPKATMVSFCGPKGLLDQVQAQLRALGVPVANLQHEYFQFR